MKAFTLFLLRLATGFYLVAWAGVKLVSTERAIEISRTFYLGYFSDPVVQHGLGALAAVLGIFVALGFLRSFAYPVQALVLGIGAAAVGKVVVSMPTDFANVVTSATLLLPTLAVFLLSLVPLVWWKDDFLALDRFIDFRRGELAEEAAAKTAVAAAVAHVEPVAHAAEVVHAAEPAHVEPAHAAEVHVAETPAHQHEAAHADHEDEVHVEPSVHDKHETHAAPAAVH